MVGIDVGKTTSTICVIDARTASVVREIETETSISAIGDIVGSYDEISTIAMESGNLSRHLVTGLRVSGWGCPSSLPLICPFDPASELPQELFR